MKADLLFVSFVLLSVLPMYGTQRMDGRAIQCRSADCAERPMRVCNTLNGRGSDHSTPQNLPPNIRLDNRSLVICNYTLQVILTVTQSPRACLQFVLHLLCLVASPPCNPSSSIPLLLCPETCHAHDKLISSGLCDRFVASVTSYLDESMLPEFEALTVYFNAFNCSDPSTYFQNYTANECNISQSSCTNLFNKQTQDLIIKSDSLYSCEPLTGSLCQALFPNSFVRTLQIPGRAETEEKVFDVLAEVSPFLDQTCNEWLNLIACNFIHPSCNENGEQRALCRGECENILKIFQENCRLIEKLGNINFTVQNSFLETLLNVNCSDTDSYLIPSVPIDNTTCFSAPDLLSTIEDERDGYLTAKNIGITVAGVIGGLLLLLLVVGITFLCTKTRTRHKMKEMLMSQDVLRHLTLSRSLTPQLQTLRNMRGNQLTNERARLGGDGVSEERVLMLSDAEQEEFERQFSGSVVQFSSLTMDSCIGQGSFGKVYSGTMEVDGIRTTVAIKTIKLINSEDQLRSFLEESLIMKDFKHRHVLSLLGVCFNTPDHSPYIILPFMANGSVKTYLRANRVHPTNFDDCPVGLKLGDLVQMCIDIAEGMKYLTENKFVHRDLAARNCMVNEEGVVLVGDFGLARDIYTAEYYRNTGHSKVPVKWMPPEALNDGISNEKTDIWSYGVTCWEVFSLGRSPYPGIENHEILQHISTGGRLGKPSLCPEQLYTLLVQCWAALPEERPSFAELCAHLKDYWDEQHLYVVQSF